jgi:hypothetical protein
MCSPTSLELDVGLAEQKRVIDDGVRVGRRVHEAVRDETRMGLPATHTGISRHGYVRPNGWQGCRYVHAQRARCMRREFVRRVPAGRSRAGPFGPRVIPSAGSVHARTVLNTQDVVALLLLRAKRQGLCLQRPRRDPLGGLHPRRSASEQTSLVGPPASHTPAAWHRPVAAHYRPGRHVLDGMLGCVDLPHPQLLERKRPRSHGLWFLPLHR